MAISHRLFADRESDTRLRYRRALLPTTMDNTYRLERLKERHGEEIARDAIQSDLNLDAIRMMSKDDARRAVDLATSVRRGISWRRERVRMSDDDLALVVLVMSPAQADAPDADGSSADEPLQYQEPMDVEPPEPPQVEPGTVARSRSSRSRGA